ncbi:MAG: hypothetical protein ACSLFA_27690 [Mycobacterium sp.]
MSTLEFVSTSAVGISESAAPLVTGPTVVAGLGALPSLSLPLVCGREPDSPFIWRRLEETARFYGTPIPALAALADTLGGFLDEAAARHGAVALAVRVLVVGIDGHPQFVVSGAVIDPVSSTPVVLDVTSGPDHGPVPHWRQMAARTTSQADTDLAEHDLNARGFADVLTVDGDLAGRPRLGAVVFDSADGAVGVDPDGSDRLALLQDAGLLGAVTHSRRPVTLSATTGARWVSPRFETHTVSAVGAHRYPGVSA